MDIALCRKRSKIHGKGIFTKKSLPPRHIFYKIPTKIISNKPKKGWAFIGNKKWVYDKKILNYINHSCNPNSILNIYTTPKLISKKKIKAGEEITINYNKTEKNGEKTPCNCKSKKCKKYFLRIV